MASILRKKICKECKKAKKSLNSDGICEDCQEKIDIANSKKACAKCGELVLESSLDKDGFCGKCVESEENIKQGQKKGESGGGGNKNKKIIWIMAGFIVLVAILVIAYLYIAKPVGSDTIPNSFSFERQNDVNKNTEIVSNEITVSGINTPTDIKINHGEYSIDGRSWIGAEGTINNGSHVRVKHTSSSIDGDIVSTNLLIGGISGKFITKTKLKTRKPKDSENKSNYSSDYAEKLGFHRETAF